LYFEVALARKVVGLYDLGHNAQDSLGEKKMAERLTPADDLTGLF